MTTWTANHETLLVQLSKLNLSAGRIAAMLGGGLTRNAVLAKLLQPSAPTPQVTRPAAPKAIIPIKPVATAVTLARAPLTPMPVLASPPRPPNHISIVDLTPNQCKFPIGDTNALDFTFCGQDQFKAKPYCEFHCQIAYPKWRAK